MGSFGSSIRPNKSIMGNIGVVYIVEAGTITTAQHEFTLLDVVAQVNLGLVMILAIVTRDITVCLSPGIFRNDAIFGDL